MGPFHEGTVIKNHKYVTHHACICINRDFQQCLSKSLSDKEPRKGASLASQLIIIASFCQGSVFWRSLALIS
jgi:hypothetical protein